MSCSDCREKDKEIEDLKAIMEKVADGNAENIIKYVDACELLKKKDEEIKQLKEAK